MSNPRAEYSPITNRQPLRLPGNARVAVWIVINVEEWAFDAPMPRGILTAPQGRSFVPDVPNFAWAEYGLRVGFWRMKEVLDRYQVKATVALNASVCNTYPQLVEAVVKDGWEILGHGYVQRALPAEEDEEGVIRRSIQLLKEKTGRTPRGWLGPGLAETYNTLDILARAGIEYVCDWVNDDQPYRLKVKEGTLYSVPYTLELNDITLYLKEHQRPPELLERAQEHLETLNREGATNARVMAIGTHPHLMGVPHRIGYFQRLVDYLKQHEGVLLMTGSQVLDWYKQVTGEGKR
ncbi:MAG: polysaccharide deacetylase family protein [Chloroflexi bacterium]|nr:polysaccharide deacetylase family protein [Chloroflexota bacterium]